MKTISRPWERSTHNLHLYFASFCLLFVVIQADFSVSFNFNLEEEKFNTVSMRRCKLFSWFVSFITLLVYSLSLFTSFFFFCHFHCIVFPVSFVSSLSICDYQFKSQETVNVQVYLCFCRVFFSIITQQRQMAKCFLLFSYYTLTASCFLSRSLVEGLMNFFGEAARFKTGK